MNADNAKGVLRWVALGALFAIPFMPLVIAGNLFFPFITGKAFFFRIFAEVAFCAWLGLAVLDRAYRPRISAIGVALLAFVAWMVLADAFAINAAKAFWSNFERMEGWIWLAHLTGFFFAASAVLRVEKKWRAWFFTSVGASVLVSGYALLQLAGVLAIHQGVVRIDATLGNSAYLAIYLLFSIFIALWLAFTSEQIWRRRALISLAGLEGLLLFQTETRGAILGLVCALVLTAGLTALTAGRRARRIAAGGLLGLVLVVGGFYLARDSAFVQESHVLTRIASISLKDGTTRFTIWNMALQGVVERPVLGWGQEGFNYVFNTYYDPSLYRQESWFDRAHDAFVDWLSAGGVPAFALYLALFGTTITLLWRRSELSRPERILLTAALAGYAVHNIFVFDNLTSYMYFFAVLAFVDSQTARVFERCEALPEARGDGVTLAVSGVFALALIWGLNVPGIRVASGLVTALSHKAGGYEENVALFERLLARPAFAAQEVREQTVSFATSVVQNKEVPTDIKQRAADLAVSATRAQVDAYPLDARGHVELAYAYRVAGDLKDALKEMLKAAELSPNKPSLFVSAGLTAWGLGDYVAANDYFAQAHALAPQFPELSVYAAAGRIGLGDFDGADAILEGAYGTTVVDNDLLLTIYYQFKAWDRLIAIWELRASKQNATAETWFGLAAAYYVSGDPTHALAVLDKTLERFPETATSVASAKAQIRAGK